MLLLFFSENEPTTKLTEYWLPNLHAEVGNDELHLLRYIYVTFTFFYTFRVYLKMGNFTLTQVNFLLKNCTFTSLLWATHLLLLYLYAIQVKNASIYSKRAV